MKNAAAGAAGVAATLGASNLAGAVQTAATNTSRILNHNENMEYRRLGKTELMVSAVCMGGHTGRIDEREDFDKNRYDVISRLMDVGINYIDACSDGEVMYACKALKGRRDKMYVALSDCGREVREEDARTSKKLLTVLDNLLRRSKQEYTDLWRITCFEPGGRHTFNTSCELVDALEKAKQQGKARFAGISSHDRRWLTMMVEQFPQLDVVLFPYTAMSKNYPNYSLFDVLREHDVGAFGIKPFAAASLFKGDSMADSPHAVEDDRRARLAIRYILRNPGIIPIPGLSSVHQVDNVAKAVMERRELDKKEHAELDKAAAETFAKLPADYQWLKDWEYV